MWELHASYYLCLVGLTDSLRCRLLLYIFFALPLAVIPNQGTVLRNRRTGPFSLDIIPHCAACRSRRGAGTPTYLQSSSHRTFPKFLLVLLIASSLEQYWREGVGFGYSIEGSSTLPITLGISSQDLYTFPSSRNIL
jgi:hypothetical protein